MPTKIIVSIYLILLPVLLIGVSIVYVWLYRSTMREDVDLYQGFAGTVSSDIEYMQKDVLDIADYFAVNADIHQILNGRKEEYEGNGLFWTENAPMSFISDTLAIKSQIKTLILYPENGLSPYYVSRDASVHNTDLNEIRNLQIYQDIAEVKGDVIWKRVDTGAEDIFLRNKTDKIVAYRMLFDMSKQKKLGVLAIGIEASAYLKSCENVIRYDNEGILLLNRNDEVLLRTEQVSDEVLQAILEMDRAQLLDIPADGFHKIGKNHVFCHQNPGSNVLVCYISPDDNWDLQSHQSLLLPFAMAVLLLLGSWPMSWLISGNLSKSTKLLLESMDRFRSGDLSQRVDISSDDEIGQIAKAFNVMAADIQTLVDKNYRMELREKEIELNALQAQINPHFLYNVLDSLYWEAVNSDNEKLGEDILTLSELFRLLLSQGKSEIEVGKEIDLVSRYLSIQQMRFSKKFQFDVDVDEEILQYKISKLLLQPFVENAVVHGLEQKKTGGYVAIHGRRVENRMEFVIEDDGVGMDQEEADALLEASPEEAYPSLRMGHYAIRNIKERLSLRYGDDYKMEIRSQKGKGTRVTIDIPITH